MGKPPAPTWQPLALAMTEDQLLGSVVDLARLQGWLVHHCRPARLADGRWRTPVQGDGGFPDLVLAREPQVLFVELKSERGRVATGQARWRGALLGCPSVGCRLWRPSDWHAGHIRRELTGPA